MEGLEISEVKLSDLDSYKRIDAELFNKNYVLFKSAIKQIAYTTFADECIVIRKGIFNVNSDCYCNKGVPFVRISNLDSMIIDTKDMVYIPSEVHKNNLKTELKRGDIVLSKTAIAAASIVNLDYCNVSQDIVAIKLNTNSKVLSHYVVVFLNTIYGNEQLQRRFTGNVQMHLNLEECKNEVMIPVFPIQFQLKIKTIFEKAIQLLSQSQTLYLEAQKLLLENLNDWQHKKNQVNVKSLKESFLSSGRLDAEYYLPVYEDLFNLLKQYKTTTLGNVVAIQKSIEPGSNCYLKKGTPFVRVADLTKFGIAKPSIFLDKDIFKDVIRPKQDTILMSKDGSIGIAYKVEKDEDFITSSAILHLQIIDNNILPDYLTLVINSKVVQMQAERDAGGSIIQHWKPSEISNVVIPILPMEKQQEISQKVQESFRLRNESKRLLNVAKTAVEIAIGESEEAALEYLKENENG